MLWTERHTPSNSSETKNEEGLEVKQEIAPALSLVPEIVEQRNRDIFKMEFSAVANEMNQRLSRGASQRFNEIKQNRHRLAFSNIHEELKKKKAPQPVQPEPVNEAPAVQQSEPVNQAPIASSNWVLENVENLYRSAANFFRRSSSLDVKNGSNPSSRNTAL
jgi:hypothetical protein